MLISKIKDLQAAKAKTPFKTVVDVDAHIKYVLLPTTSLYKPTYLFPGTWRNRWNLAT